MDCSSPGVKWTKGHCPRMIQTCKNVRMAMPKMSEVWGGGGEKRKTTKEIFPSKDDGKDRKGKMHTSQTEGRAIAPIIWELEDHYIRKESFRTPGARGRHQVHSFQPPPQFKTMGSQSQERLNNLFKMAQLKSIPAFRLHSRVPFPQLTPWACW